MKVIIAWSGDSIGQEVDRTTAADDADGLRRINQAIDRANAVWKSWVEAGGGSMVSAEGADGRAQVLAEKLSDMPRIKSQYGQAIGSSVSVGVGMKPSEADRALKVAQRRGGDRIVLYTPDIDQELGQKDTAPTDQLAQEHLGKADGPKGPSAPAMAPGPAAGFTGASPPSAPTMDTPQVEASEHSQGEAAQALVDEQPPPPEGTHAAADFEDQFHEAANKDEQQAQGQPVQTGNPQEQVRAQVVQVLQALKAQAPILEQIKQTAPDTYAVVMAMVQAVITMAKQINGEPTHTTVKELDDRARSQAEIQVPLPPEEGESKGEDAKKSELLFKGQRGDWKAEGYRIQHELAPDGKTMSITAHLGDALVGDMDAAHSHAEPGTLYPVMVRVHPDHRRKGLGTAMYQRAEEVLGAKFKRGAYQSPEAKALWNQKDRPFGKSEKESKPKDWHDCKEFGHCWGDGATGEHCLMCGEKQEVEDLDKASLSPGAGKPPPTRHHLNLPVGSHMDPGPTATRRVGRIKVLHPETGKQGWIQARAGQILSRDGHAISSRNPGGK